MSVAGVWQNQYGSKMTLRMSNPNLVMGTYISSTGSSGTYRVIGWQTNDDPTPQLGQPVCLAIEWHSIVQGPPDNSWHWVSGLSGQINIVSGKEQLVLAHALVASVEFPDFAPAGTYIDKLIYTRVGEEYPGEDTDAPDSNKGAVGADPTIGTWFADDGTMLDIMSVVPSDNNAFGYITGKMTWGGGPSMIYGVTDINATSSGLALQSVSIAGLPSDGGGPAISLSGTLDLSSSTMTLVDLQSTATAPRNSYLQTQVATLIFNKN